MSSEEPRPYTITDSQIVWSCPWYGVRRDGVLLPDGRHGEYNVVQKGDAVIVVPLTAAQEVVLIRVYRHTLDRWAWEVPAGSIKPDQSPDTAVLAELAEEVGGEPDRLHLLGEFYSMNGISNEKGYYYVAEGVSLGEMSHEPMEMMSRHVRPFADVMGMVAQGEIVDSLTVLALMLVRDYLD